MRWRLARVAGIPADRQARPGGPAMSGAGRELTAREVLADLLGGAEFDHEILDPDAAARLIIEGLRDAGFEIVPTTRGERS
jgi:hypothetical protein